MKGDLLDLDRALFDARYAELFSDLAHLCRALGAGHDAEDIAQESILAGRKELEKLRDDAKVVPWLRRIAVRGVQSRRRKVERRLLSRLDGEQPPWSDEFAVADLAADERAAIARLPFRERQYITLLYFAGYGQEEVAEMLNVSRGTVAKTAWKARAALAHYLADYAGPSR